jgi:hypothetical protein
MRIITIQRGGKDEYEEIMDELCVSDTLIKDKTYEEV